MLQQSPGLQFLLLLVVAVPLALIGWRRLAVQPVSVGTTANNTPNDSPIDSVFQYPPGIIGWALRQGLDDAKHLEAGSFPKGSNGQLVNGISTTRDVRRDDIVLRIPASLLMWSHGAAFLENCAWVGENTVPPRLLHRDCAGIRNNTTCARIRLVACLNAIRRYPNVSTWGGYVNNLPSWEDMWMYHPMAADEALLDSFAELPLVREIRARQEARQKRFNRLQRLGGVITQEDFNWADLAITIHGRGSVMVPLGDSMTMSRSGSQNVVEESGGGVDDEGAGALVYRATADIPMGNEIITADVHGPEADVIEAWGFPTTCRTVISTVSTTTCRTNFARDLPIEPLPAKRCKDLVRTVGAALTDRSKLCRPPAEEPQKATFCAFSRLVVDHCARFY